MVKMVGLSPLSEVAPVGVSVAGTLGVQHFSELGLLACNANKFILST